MDSRGISFQIYSFFKVIVNYLYYNELINLRKRLHDFLQLAGRLVDERCLTIASG